MSGVNMGNRRHGGGRVGGFTLIDTLIIVAIIAILAMLAVPALQSLIADTRLNAAAGELLSGLGYAADLAVIHQRPFGVRASAGSMSFSVFDARYRNDSSAHTAEGPPTTAFGVVLNPIDKKWYSRDLDGVVISVAPTAGEVLFYPNGNCSGPSNTLVVTYGGDTRTVSVNGVTGRITVQ